MAADDTDSLLPDDVESESGGGMMSGIRSLHLSNNFMKFILAVVMFIILQTDIFINRVLSNVNGAVVGTSVTTYGTCIQAIILALALLIFDLILDHS
jgi:hypothetical protein